MAKFKKYNYDQMMMVPVTLKDQLLEGTMEHAINEIVEKKINLTHFLENYNNDDTGRPAYDPKILLKVILLSYCRGVIGSRRIERLCRENITFMALTCGQSPDHSTIAHFISSMNKEVIKIIEEQKEEQRTLEVETNTFKTNLVERQSSLRNKVKGGVSGK